MPDINSNSETSHPEEIDLLKIMTSVAIFSLKYYKIILVFTAIGLLIGIGLKLLPKSTYYSAYLVAETNLKEEKKYNIAEGSEICINTKDDIYARSMQNSSEQDIFEIIKAASFSIQNNKYDDVSKKMKLSISNSQQLKSINIESIVIPSEWNANKKPIKYIKSNLFKISIDYSIFTGNPDTYNQRAFLDSIRNGIITLINENPFIKERQEYIRKNNIELINLINSSLGNSKLPNSINTLIDNDGITKKTGNYLFSNQLITLLEKKTELERSIKVDKPIIIVEDFNYIKVEEPIVSLRKIILICFGFFALGLIVAFTKEITPAIKDNLKNR